MVDAIAYTIAIGLYLVKRSVTKVLLPSVSLLMLTIFAVGKYNYGELVTTIIASDCIITFLFFFHQRKDKAFNLTNVSYFL